MTELAIADLASVAGGYGNNKVFRNAAGEIVAMINGLTGAFVKFENGKPVGAKK